MLEPQLLSCLLPLSKTVQHFVLVDNSLPFPPVVVATPSLKRKYNLGLSMMQRLMQCNSALKTSAAGDGSAEKTSSSVETVARLKFQSRMRPELAEQLVVTGLFPDLQTCPSDGQRAWQSPDLPSILSHSCYFWTHNSPNQRQHGEEEESINPTGITTQNYSFCRKFSLNNLFIVNIPHF